MVVSSSFPAGHGVFQWAAVCTGLIGPCDAAVVVSSLDIPAGCNRADKLIRLLIFCNATQVFLSLAGDRHLPTDMWILGRTIHLLFNP